MSDVGRASLGCSPKKPGAPAFLRFTLTVDTAGTSLEIRAPDLNGRTGHGAVRSTGVSEPVSRTTGARGVLGVVVTACLGCCIAPILGLLSAIAALGVVSNLVLGSRHGRRRDSGHRSRTRGTPTTTRMPARPLRSRRTEPANTVNDPARFTRARSITRT